MIISFCLIGLPNKVTQSSPYLTLPFPTSPYYLTLPYPTSPCLTLPYPASPYLTLPYATLNLTKTLDLGNYPKLLLDWATKSSHSILTLPHPTFPYFTLLPYPTLPYITLPHPTLPYLTLPHPLTLPYLTLPCFGLLLRSHLGIVSAFCLVLVL